jgi:hypothetical protein
MFTLPKFTKHGPRKVDYVRTRCIYETQKPLRVTDSIESHVHVMLLKRRSDDKVKMSKRQITCSVTEVHVTLRKRSQAMERSCEKETQYELSKS